MPKKGRSVFWRFLSTSTFLMVSVLSLILLPKDTFADPYNLETYCEQQGRTVCTSCHEWNDDHTECLAHRFFCCGDPTGAAICAAGYYPCVNGSQYGGYGNCCPVGTSTPPSAPHSNACGAWPPEFVWIENSDPETVYFVWKARNTRWRLYGGVTSYEQRYPNSFHCLTLRFPDPEDNIEYYCLYRSGILPSTQLSQGVPKSLFQPGQAYLFMLYALDQSCNRYSMIPWLSSCDIFPSSLNLEIRQTATITSTVNEISDPPGGWTDTNVFLKEIQFISSNPNVFSVNPTVVTNNIHNLKQVYKTTVKGVGGGDATITSNAILKKYGDYPEYLISCEGQATINTQGEDQSPWWQVVDGDVTTNGNITSDVSVGNVFIDDGTGGYPGVPTYGGNLNTGSGTTSSKNWNSDTTTTLPRTFNYSYFESLIPADTTGSEYEWYIISSDTTINFTNFGSKKVIYFIDGDLTINGNLRVDDGVGFAGFFVSGDINVSSNARNLEGVYLSDGDFNTAFDKTGDTLDLKVRGSVVAGSFDLERELADNAEPAEIFTFAPDQILLFPKELMFKRVKWAEVAP